MFPIMEGNMSKTPNLYLKNWVFENNIMPFKFLWSRCMESFCNICTMYIGAKAWKISKSLKTFTLNKIVIKVNFSPSTCTNETVELLND